MLGSQMHCLPAACPGKLLSPLTLLPHGDVEITAACEAALPRGFSEVLLQSVQQFLAPYRCSENVSYYHYHRRYCCGS